MADYVRVPLADWQGICDAVRGKTGGEAKLLSGEVAPEVTSIDTVNNQDVQISANGTYTPDTEHTGFGSVTVDVAQEEPVLQDLTITENGEYSAGEGYDGLGVVTVNVEASGGGSSGDGSAAFYSGSFTPSENVLDIEISVPGAFTHFLLYACGGVTGNSVKATGLYFLDRTRPRHYAIPTNNAGGALSAWTATSAPSGGEGRVYYVLNNTRVTIYADNRIEIVTSSPSGTCLGYFIAGVTYQWFAW